MGSMTRPDLRGRFVSLVAKFASTWTSQSGRRCPETLQRVNGNYVFSGFQIRLHLGKPEWKADCGVSPLAIHLAWMEATFGNQKL
jgi:hypothetical protein